MRRLVVLKFPVVVICLLALLLIGVGALVLRPLLASAATDATCQAGQPCGRWSVSPTVNPGSLGNNLYATTAPAANDIWAAGEKTEVVSFSGVRPYSGCGCYRYALMEHFNGTAWSVVSHPAKTTPSSEIMGMAAISSTDVWAVGDSYDTTLSANQTLIEHWNGSAWSLIPGAPIAPGGKLTAVSGRTTDNVWAVGYIYDASHNKNTTLIEHWNGTAWSAVPSPNASSGGTELNSQLSSVTVISANNIWAVGYASPGYFATLIEHWDGSNWSIVPSPNTSIDNNQLFGVSGTGANDIWAVGASSYSSNLQSGGPLIEHWNGTAWTISPASDPATKEDQLLSVIARGRNNVWAVGTQGDYIGSQTTPLLEHWNGTAWSQKPTPPLTPAGRQVLSAITSSPDGTLIAVGYFRDVTTTYEETWALIRPA